MIDFGQVRRKEETWHELVDELGITRESLGPLTGEVRSKLLEVIVDLDDADVTCVPLDPDTNDPSWTLCHVIVRATAYAEEAAPQGLTLARGIDVREPSCYEVPWESATTAEFIEDRLQESRRIRLAMLTARPDRPHLNIFHVSAPGQPGRNAIARFASGIYHDDGHVDHIRKIAAQAKAGREGSRQSDRGRPTMARCP